MLQFPVAVRATRALGAAALLLAAVLPGAAWAQSAAPEVAAGARAQVLASEQQAWDWLRSTQRALGKREEQKEALRASAGGTTQKTSDAPWIFRQAVLSPAGDHRATIECTVTPQEGAKNPAQALILGDGGTVQRRFPVVPYNHFAVTDDGRFLVAYGNELNVAWQCGDLLTHLVFYDASGNVVGSDDGRDFSNLHSELILSTAGVFVMSQPEKLVAWNLADGSRTWSRPLPAMSLAQIVRLGSGPRFAVVVTSQQQPQFLVLDASGTQVAQLPYQGRPAPGQECAVVSDDGSIVAIGDIVNESVRYRILDAATGEVLRELR